MNETLISLITSKKLGVLGESLSESQIEEIETRIQAKQKKKEVVTWLHLFFGFWAPFLYFGRRRASLICLLGLAAYLSFAYLSEPFVNEIVFQFFGYAFLVVWVLGFGYFRKRVDKVNLDISKTVLNEYIQKRLGFEED